MKKEMRVNREQERANRTRDLYSQMLASGNGDRDYAGKVLKQLLAFQKEDGSFCASDQIPAERDSRIYYYYVPTYYGAAALMHVMLDDSYTEDKMVREALSKVLHIAMQRKLAGHGYDAVRQQLGALKIFKYAGLYEWMCRFDDSSDNIFHDFCGMIRDIIEGYRERIINGNTRGDWDVDFKEEFEKEVADFEEGMVPYVWYASYGSNIKSSRFQRYLNNCGGDVAAIENRAYTAQGTLYFAAESTTWGLGKGVAFYDETAAGSVLMRVYKITRSQFREVQRMEGSKYNRKLMMGSIDDIPVYTFTALNRREDMRAPSAEYVQTILSGLKEAYPELSETVLLSYLFRHGAISNDARNIVAYIRKAPHAVSINEMIEDNSCPAVTRIRDAVKFLLELGLIKQDSRSIRAGHRAAAPEAMYFTIPEKRDIIDLVVYGII